MAPPQRWSRRGSAGAAAAPPPRRQNRRAAALRHSEAARGTEKTNETRDEGRGEGGTGRRREKDERKEEGGGEREEEEVGGRKEERGKGKWKGRGKGEGRGRTRERGVRSEGADGKPAHMRPGCVCGLADASSSHARCLFFPGNLRKSLRCGSRVPPSGSVRSSARLRTSLRPWAHTTDKPRCPPTTRAHTPGNHQSEGQRGPS